MNNPSPLSSLSLRRRPNPGLSSFQALLDLLPAPTLLAEASSGRVLLANTRMTEISTFTRDELQRQNLATLFSGLERSALLEKISSTGPRQAEAKTRTHAVDQPGAETVFPEKESHEILTALVQRKGPAVEVFLTATVLDPQKKWLLVTLDLALQRRHRQAEAQRQAHLREAHRALAQAGQDEDARLALEKALQAGCSLTGASILAVYAEAGGPIELKRSAALGCAELFPEIIQASDLASFPEPLLWRRGKRPENRFARLARQAGLTYLAAAPLGQPDALIGLLVAGGETSPAPDLLPLLKLTAEALTAILQHAAQIDSLRQELHHRLEAQARGAALMETIGDGVIVVAPDLSIVDLNPSAEAILGYASQEVRGQPYNHILVGTDNLIPSFLLDPGEGFTAPTPHSVGNTRLYRRNGQPFLAQVHTLPVMVEGQLASLVILIADLSKEEQFRLRSQQLEQRALLGEVTAVFAHEVRNPINNISTGLQLMSLNLPPDDPNQEIISRLQGDCDRLADLMKSVLAFARPVEYKMEPVDVGQSIRRLMERWRPQMARAHVQSSLQIEPGTPPVAGDVRALEQVWNNLISNALQAMEEMGGTLSIKIYPLVAPDGNQRVEVSVLDTGPGIPEEVRERIFEPFFTTKRSGTGLGLAITKHIVTAHKGSVSVISIPGGTVFQVQLPVSDAQKHV